jgi:hypothetical protein
MHHWTLDMFDAETIADGASQLVRRKVTVKNPAKSRIVSFFRISPSFRYEYNSHPIPPNDIAENPIAINEGKGLGM